jgi:hypothetical protein
MNEDIMTMIEDCAKRKSKLSEQENNFIIHMQYCIKHDRGLSIKQMEWLEKIWDRIT